MGVTRAAKLVGALLLVSMALATATSYAEDVAFISLGETGPAGNGTAPNGTSRTPPPPSNGTNPNGTTPTPPPPSNGTNPNGTTPTPPPPSNGTTPTPPPPSNGTNPNGTTPTPPPSNGTIPTNGTKPNNNTNPAGSIPVNGTNPATAGPRGPSIYLPTRQDKPGRPEVNIDRTSEKIKVSAGAYSFDVEASTGVPKFRLKSENDRAGSQWSISLVKMFATNVTGVNGKEKVEAKDRFNQIDLLAVPALYSWEVTAPVKTEDDVTRMVAFQVKGNPTSSSVPFVAFDEIFLTNEDRTTTKFDFRVNGMPESYWKVPLSGDRLNKFVAVYRITRINRLAQELEVPKGLRTIRNNTIVVPKRPISGQNGGEENVNLNTISVGGIDLGLVSTATNGDNVPHKVTAQLGYDLDESPVVFIFYDNFGTQLLHDPYAGLNPNSLDSAASFTQPHMLVAILCVLLAIIFEYRF